MAHPTFTLRQLLEAGVHFGHQSHRWNPLMEPYIHSKKNGIHILDLTQTVPMLDVALAAISKTVADGGSVLFVGTKRQAQVPIAEAAERCAQYYINHRWLGGTLTNWNTVSNSINRLDSIEGKLAEGIEGLTKKERLGMEREQSKLSASLGGIREMGGLPDILFVIDVKKEALAVAEANKLSIPVVAVVDTNCSPQGVTHIIPGNDDASRSIALYCELAASAALDGMEKQMGEAGVDIGEFVGDSADGDAKEQAPTPGKAKKRAKATPPQPEAADKPGSAKAPDDAPAAASDDKAAAADDGAEDKGGAPSEANEKAKETAAHDGDVGESGSAVAQDEATAAAGDEKAATAEGDAKDKGAASDESKEGAKEAQIQSEAADEPGSATAPDEAPAEASDEKAAADDGSDDKNAASGEAKEEAKETAAQDGAADESGSAVAQDEATAAADDSDDQAPASEKHAEETASASGDLEDKADEKAEPAADAGEGADESADPASDDEASKTA